MPILPTMLQEAKATFDVLRDEGKVDYLGCQGHTTNLRQAMIASGLFDFCVDAYNLVRMEMAEHATDLQERGMSLFPIQPLHAGLLTDARADQSTLPAGDRFLDAQHDETYARLAAVREELGEEIGPSLTGFSLRFALSHPCAPAVITGMNSPEQVAGILKAAESPLPSAEVTARALRIWQAHRESQ
jgi:aryl-alcohol dehydrogenase-like predicted oxidoreductase